MKRYRVLTALTFLALPCWLGTSAIPLLAYADSFLACKGLLDVFRVFGKCPALMAGAIPIAAVVWRIIEILRGNGWRVVAVSGWWRIVPTVLSCAFWGFFVMVAVVEGTKWLLEYWAEATWTSATWFANAMTATTALACLMPIVMTLYFVVLAVHRIAYLLDRRRGKRDESTDPLAHRLGFMI